MVCIDVQNLVAIDLVIDNKKLKIFGAFGLKTLFTPPKMGF